MQLVILFILMVFADGTVKTHVETYPTEGDCRKVESIYWKQKPEVYVEANVVSMFTECLNVVPRTLATKKP